MMWFYSEAEANPDIMNKQVNYVSGLSQTEQYFKYEGIKPGQTYTVPQLVESMIINSDNNAALALAQIMGPEQLTRVLLDFNLRPVGSSTDEKAFKIDTKSHASFYRILYRATYLTPEDSENALKLLTKTKFTQGLRAGVPSNIEVAHKFGEWSDKTRKQIHDCGIVYDKKHPYVLCVMNAGSDFDSLAQNIATISKTVYDTIEK
jgi:beta-lactamase class A